MSNNVVFFSSPEERVDLDDLSPQEFQDRFAGYQYLLVRRGRSTVYAACKTTHDELQEVVEQVFHDQPLFQGHREVEFAIALGPDGLIDAMQASREMPKDVRQ